MKHIIKKCIAGMVGSAFMLGSMSVISASANETDIRLSAQAEAIIQNAYQELGFDDSDILNVSRTSIPVQEIYAFVDAKNIITGLALSISCSTDYNCTYLSYATHIDGSVISSYSVSDSTTSSPSINRLTGTFGVSASNTASSFNVTLFRFQPTSAVTYNSSFISNIYNNTYLSTPIISSFIMGEYSSTPAAALYLSTGVFVPGDVNNDGYINNTDTTVLASALSGGTTLSVNMRKSADVNHDGTVDNNDLTKLFQYLNGNITYFFV